MLRFHKHNLIIPPFSVAYKSWDEVRQSVFHHSRQVKTISCIQERFSLGIPPLYYMNFDQFSNKIHVFDFQLNAIRNLTVMGRCPRLINAGLTARVLKRWVCLVFQNKMPFTNVLKPTPKVVEYL